MRHKEIPDRSLYRRAVGIDNGPGSITLNPAAMLGPLSESLAGVGVVLTFSCLGDLGRHRFRL